MLVEKCDHERAWLGVRALLHDERPWALLAVGKHPCSAERPFRGRRLSSHVAAEEPAQVQCDRHRRVGLTPVLHQERLLVAVQRYRKTRAAAAYGAHTPLLEPHACQAPLEPIAPLCVLFDERHDPVVLRSQP